MCTKHHISYSSRSVKLDLLAAIEIHRCTIECLDWCVLLFEVMRVVSNRSSQSTVAHETEVDVYHLIDDSTRSVWASFGTHFVSSHYLQCCYRLALLQTPQICVHAPLPFLVYLFCLLLPEVDLLMGLQ